MKINYKEISYFQTRPDVVKIFDDLDGSGQVARQPQVVAILLKTSE